MDRRDKTLAAIAASHLYLETLETRNSDSLDFHDWSVKAALEAAYEAGRQSRAPVLPKDRDKGGKVIALAIKSNDKSAA